MLSVKQGKKIVQKARTFKLIKDLASKLVAEKFELEKRYYAAKGIDWEIITEKEVPNIEFDVTSFGDWDYFTAELAALISLATSLG